MAVSGKVTDKHSAICEQLLALIVDQNYDKAALVAKRDELIAGSNPQVVTKASKHVLCRTRT